MIPREDTNSIDAAHDALVWQWKRSVALTQLRFSEPLARAVANEDLDLHYLEGLVERDCPPLLAVELARDRASWSGIAGAPAICTASG